MIWFTKLQVRLQMPTRLEKNIEFLDYGVMVSVGFFLILTLLVRLERCLQDAGKATRSADV